MDLPSHGRGRWFEPTIAHFKTLRFAAKMQRIKKSPRAPSGLRAATRAASASLTFYNNHRATHPVNAVLSYVYAVLESQVRIATVSQGLDHKIWLPARHPSQTGGAGVRPDGAAAPFVGSFGIEVCAFAHLHSE
jgi:hypothetical protein